jgi:hypothetical protein
MEKGRVGEGGYPRFRPRSKGFLGGCGEWGRGGAMAGSGSGWRQQGYRHAARSIVSACLEWACGSVAAVYKTGANWVGSWRRMGARVGRAVNPPPFPPSSLVASVEVGSVVGPGRSPGERRAWSSMGCIDVEAVRRRGSCLDRRRADRTDGGREIQSKNPPLL